MTDLVDTLVKTAIKLVQEGYRLEAQNKLVQVSESFDIRAPEGHYKGTVSVALNNDKWSVKTPVYGVTISAAATSLNDKTEGILATKLNVALRGLGLEPAPLQVYPPNNRTVLYTKS